MPFPDRQTVNVLLTILLFAVVLAVVYIARTVLIVFCFAILFAYLINPVIQFLQRHSLFLKDLAVLMSPKLMSFSSLASAFMRYCRSPLATRASSCAISHR